MYFDLNLDATFMYLYFGPFHINPVKAQKKNGLAQFSQLVQVTGLQISPTFY